MQIFRLTRYDEFVGYIRRTGSYELYSKDLYGWNGKAIDYDYKEGDTGFRDKNNRRIFVHDIVHMTYYRNPVALKQTGVYLLRVQLNKKGKMVCRWIDSGEIRPVEFLSHAISLEVRGRSPLSNGPN